MVCPQEHAAQHKAIRVSSQATHVGAYPAQDMRRPPLFQTSPNIRQVSSSFTRTLSRQNLGRKIEPLRRSSDFFPLHACLPLLLGEVAGPCTLKRGYTTCKTSPVPAA